MAKSSQEKQSAKFIAAAHEHDCDEDPAAWDRRLKAIVKAPAGVGLRRKPKTKVVKSARR